MTLLRKIKTAIRVLNEDGLSRVAKLVKQRILSGGSGEYSIPITAEDMSEVSMVYNLLATGDDHGIMIDVGAHWGGSLQPFARKNWMIYAFEPDTKNREKLMPAIENLPNVRVDFRAVSNLDDQDVPFFSSEVSSGISGLSNFHDSHQQTDTVKTITLKTLCKNESIQKIDFLKIDTEGYDLFVLQGFDWGGDEHPRAILTEFENNKTERLGYSFFDQAEYLTKVGYQLLISEWHPIVEYGQKHQWKRFVTNPKDITDPNAWGNILAVKKCDFASLLKIAKNIVPVN